MLGTELRKHIECYAPSKEVLDITREFFYEELPSLIIHCAAYTDVLKAESKKELCYETNVIGTRNLASLAIRMLYISTEYVFDGGKGNYNETDYPNPQNFYSFTKLLGEYESRRTKSVVVRCLFKPRPFEHDKACTDQLTSGNYVDTIAKDITRAVTIFDKLPETIHIGSGKRTTFNLAKETRPDIGETTVQRIFEETGLKLPRDTSLDCSKWEAIKNENRVRPV